jgi:putative SOS response-associated peptidase YedK
MEWGCIPFYVKDEQGYLKQRSSMLNARSERVLSDKQSYWHKIRNRRCLIPVSAFYEHREVKGLKNKVPYHIAIKGQPVFFLPGLYSVAELPDKETGELKQRWTFTILTTKANKLMSEIHNSGPNKERMPLILTSEQAHKWVGEALEEQDYQELLQSVLPAEEMEYKTVFSIRGNKLRPDGLPKNEYYKWEGVEDILV